jgi:hypothetical protein
MFGKIGADEVLGLGIGATEGTSVSTPRALTYEKVLQIWEVDLPYFNLSSVVT